MSATPEIDRLYDQLAELTAGEAGKNRDEIDRKFQRLRELQEAEARAFEKEFEESLSMPIDAGREILKRTRALRKQLEDLAAEDTSSRDGDSSAASAHVG